MNKTDQHLDNVLDRLAVSTRSPKGKYGAEAGRKLLDKRIAAWRRRRFLRIASSVAAVALLCFVSWTTYMYMQPAEILMASTQAEIKLVQLPDGTEVTLNRYSSLSYPKAFKKKNREVQLQGGAYFAVAKDKKHPFIVQADAVNVQVLGTEFNVEAYAKDELVRTVLYQGSVAVSGGGEEHALVLVPGERAVYSRLTGDMLKETVSHPADELAWQKGNFVFNNLTLKEISRQLSNAFGADIELSDSLLEQRKMTARFIHDETLDEILALLQEVGSFRVGRQGQTIHVTSNDH